MTRLEVLLILSIVLVIIAVGSIARAQVPGRFDDIETRVTTGTCAGQTLDQAIVNCLEEGNLLFIDHNDTPPTYTGQAGRWVRVNATATGLEFTTASGGGNTPTPTTPGQLIYSANGATWVLLDAGTEDQIIQIVGGLPTYVDPDVGVPTGTAIGQLQYWDGSAWALVPQGAVGKILTAAGAAIPTWQDEQDPVATQDLTDHKNDAVDPHGPAGYLKTEVDPHTSVGADDHFAHAGTAAALETQIGAGIADSGDVNCDPVTGKVIGVNVNGTLDCGVDQTGAGGGGITDLNTAVATTQNFATSTADPNIDVTVTTVDPTHTMGVTWKGQLALARLTRECSALEAIMGAGPAASPVCTDVATQAELDSHTGTANAHHTPPSAAGTANQIQTTDGAGNFQAGACEDDGSGRLDCGSAALAGGSTFSGLEADSTVARPASVPADKLYIFPCASDGGEWCKRDPGDASEQPLGAGGPPDPHRDSHESAGSDQVRHDELVDFNPDQHHAQIVNSPDCTAEAGLEGDVCSQGTAFYQCQAAACPATPWVLIWAGNESDPVFAVSEAANFVAGDKTKLDGIEAGAQVNAPLASQAEAEAGVENTKTMTALRTAQAIGAQPPSDHALDPAGGPHTGTLPEASVAFAPNDGSRHDHVEVDITDLSHVQNYREIFASNTPSCVKSGGEISLGTDPLTQITVSAGTGQIVNQPNYDGGSAQSVTWSQLTDITVVGMGDPGVEAVLVYMTSGGALQFEQWPGGNRTADRTAIYLGGIIVDQDNDNIEDYVNAPVACDSGQSLHDLATAVIGYDVVSGGEMSQNTTTSMQLDREAATAFGFGINFHASPTDPNFYDAIAESPITFKYVTRDGTVTDGTVPACGPSSEPSGVQTLQPQCWDDGISTQPQLFATNGNNRDRATTQLLYWNIISNRWYVLWGQVLYQGGAPEALDNIGTYVATVDVPEGMSQLLSLHAAIIMRHDTTDLDDSTVAAIVNLSGPGGGGGGGGGSTGGISGPTSSSIGQTMVFSDENGNFATGVEDSAANPLVVCDSITDPTTLTNPMWVWDPACASQAGTGAGGYNFAELPATGAGTDYELDSTVIVPNAIAANFSSALHSVITDGPQRVAINPATSGPTSPTLLGDTIDGCTSNETTNIVCNSGPAAQAISSDLTLSGATELSGEVNISGTFAAGSKHEEWQAFDPTQAMSCTASYTGLGFSNTTWSASAGRYKRHGNDLRVEIEGTINVMTTNAGTTWNLCVPDPFVAPAVARMPRGRCTMRLGSTNYESVLIGGAFNNWLEHQMIQMTGAAPYYPVIGFMGPSIPATWATGDTIRCAYTVTVQ